MYAEREPKIAYERDRRSSPVGYSSEEALSTEVSGANPHRLVQMLYEGALERIQLAAGAIRSGDWEERDRLVDRAVLIVNALNSSLNEKEGGELTRDIGLIYHQVTLLLLEAQQFNRVELLDEPYELLSQLKESWDRIPNKAF